LNASGRERFGWDVPVLSTSAETGEGVGVLCETLLAHHAHLKATGDMITRQGEITEMRILKTAQDQLRDLLERERRGHMKPLLQQTIDREIDPATAADQLIKHVEVT